MAEPSRFNQMRLPDISCREDESDLRGRYQPLAIGSSQLGRRKPQALRLIAGSNHAGLVDVCPLDLLFFVVILQMGYSNAPANGASLPAVFCAEACDAKAATETATDSARIHATPRDSPRLRLAHMPPS